MRVVVELWDKMKLWDCVAIGFGDIVFDHVCVGTCERVHERVTLPVEESDSWSVVVGAEDRVRMSEAVSALETDAESSRDDV